MTLENPTLADRHSKDFVLQGIQPGLLGLMDGSVSTLARIFAAAGLTGRGGPLRRGAITGVATGIGGIVLALGILAGVTATEAGASYQGGFGQHRGAPVRKIRREEGTLPPFAYIQMCVKNPGLCKNRPGRLATAGTKVRMTQKLHLQLAGVNAAVNRMIKPVRDGQTDTWNGNVSRGDCEDYVLTKLAQLLVRGWTSSALSIAVVRTHQGEKHAVLVVDTTSGRYVLDNLNRNIVPMSRAPYRFLTMQVSGSSRIWASSRG